MMHIMGMFVSVSMVCTKTFLVVFLAFVICSHAHLPVVVSRGAFITPIHGVNIYNDIELIHHVISDLPDPPSSVANTCPIGATQKSCDLSQHIHKILEDNSLVLTLLNKARTTYGLSDDQLPMIAIKETSFRSVNEPKVSNDPPTDELVKVAGRKWFDEVKDRLQDRKALANGSSDAHVISKRFVQYIKPFLFTTAAVMGADDLFDLVSSLFVGENGILKYLTTLQATTPELSIVDLSHRVSEFEASTRQLTADIVEEAAEVQRITEDLQQDVAQHKMDLATIEDSHTVSQQMMSDLGRIIFSYAIYFSVMDADTNCRGGFLSPLLLPPHLLGEKLTEVATLLPKDLKLVVGLDKIQTYYTTQCAKCLFDSHGGLITVSIPVSYKSADYKMFENRNLFFAWNSKTCTLSSGSRYIVKDVKNNQVFPIDDVDEETCSPHLTKKCRVPPASDSAESYCLNQLLSSSTVAEVRDACKMSCFEKNDTIVSKLTPNIFVAVHVPKDAMSITCPHHDVYNITEQVNYGAIRVIFNCGSCVIKLHNKTVGRSVGPNCEGHETISVDILLPGHWTTLTDLLLFTLDGSSDGTKFQHITEIFNEHAMDDEDVEDSIITTEISIVAIGWNFIHTIFITYILFRQNVMNNAAAGAMLNAVPMVEASDHHYCKLEDDVYYILFLICGLCSMAFIPPLVYKIYSFLGRQFWDAVDVQTNRRIVDGIV